MSTDSCYFLSPCDSGLTYVVNNRLFNFRVEEHGDHVHCDLSIHIVERGVALGGGRFLPMMRCRDFGACRFRLSVSDEEFSSVLLMVLIKCEPFQEFALGPLDDMAGDVDRERFDMLPD